MNQMKHTKRMKYIDILSKIIYIFSSFNYLFFALYNINCIDIFFTPNSKLIYVIIGAFGIYQLVKLVNYVFNKPYNKCRLCRQCNKCHKCSNIRSHSENTLIYTPPRFIF